MTAKEIKNKAISDLNGFAETYLKMLFVSIPSIKRDDVVIVHLREDPFTIQIQYMTQTIFKFTHPLKLVLEDKFRNN